MNRGQRARKAAFTRRPTKRQHVARQVVPEPAEKKDPPGQYAPWLWDIGKP